MKQLPTAEEFLIRQGCQRMNCDGEDCDYFEDVQPKDLIEFAKLHVQAALESAAENSMIDAEPEYGKILTRKEFDFDDRGMVCPYNLSINKQSIVNSYPLDNIK